MVILLFVFVALGFLVALLCRRLAAVRHAGRAAFAHIDVQLRRRYDLIPGLVEIVKKHMPGEREMLQAVLVARNSAVQAERRAAMKPTDPAAIQQLSIAERALAEALTRLFAESRAYPELRADASMRVLTEQLKSLQEALTVSRQAYNDALTVYNTMRKTFPANHFADVFGFAEAPLLAVEKPSDRARANAAA